MQLSWEAPLLLFSILPYSSCGGRPDSARSSGVSRRPTRRRISSASSRVGLQTLQLRLVSDDSRGSGLRSPHRESWLGTSTSFFRDQKRSPFTERVPSRFWRIP